MIIKKEYSFSKVGIDEIQGLKQEMIRLMKPIQDILKQSIYWSDVELFEAEYKYRDGFSPHSHNCGGIKIREHVPQCEEYEFDWLGFGEWDGTHYCSDDNSDTCECMYDDDGHYDAFFSIWFKFEGYNEDTKELEFYLVMSGGNNDAPYFREEHLPTLFEASFTCKSVFELKRIATKHINKLIKVIK